MAGSTACVPLVMRLPDARSLAQGNGRRAILR
ncbi:hypothetical protein M2366_003729 [Aeromonas sp. BIGb0405]|jgi:hypothetical protein|nr:hypothetical protein [Aeromonas sp. BIGb0405]